jgi:hypothetical protein
MHYHLFQEGHYYVHVLERTIGRTCASSVAVHAFFMCDESVSLQANVKATQVAEAVHQSSAWAVVMFATWMK